MDNLKITLNRSALERLIGDDHNLELLLSQNAIETFIGKHELKIRQKVNGFIERITDEKLNWASEQLFGKFEQATTRSVEKFIPSATLTEAIKKILEPLVLEKLGQVIDEKLQIIHETVNRISASYISSEIEKGVKRVIETAMLASKGAEA